MKVQAASSAKNTTNFEGEVIHGRLDVAKLGHFMQTLIKNYNNPHTATLREWVSNAWDSHRQANQTRPVRVTLPSKLSPMLTVEDWGVGMSFNDVAEVYTSFLTSTKDTDNKEIGGFGIGGKSALAIADQYTMVAVKDGLKNVFIFERSPEGGLVVKCVVKNQATEQHNGVKVSVATDYTFGKSDSFSNSSPSTLSDVLGGWRSTEVEIEDGSFDSLWTDSIEFKHGIIKKNLLSNHAKQRRSWNKSITVLVGPVRYEIDLSKFYKIDPARGHELISLFHALDRNDYAVVLPIGAATFPSSREVIEPNDANFNAVLTAAKKFYDELVAHISKTTMGFKNIREAYDFSQSHLANFFRISTVYEGRNLSEIDYAAERSYLFVQDKPNGKQEIREEKHADFQALKKYPPKNVNIVVYATDEDLNLSPDTHRKYLRGVFTQKMEEIRKSDEHLSYYISLRAILVKEKDALHEVTSDVYTFEELRKRPLVKGRAPKVTSDEWRDRANRIRVTPFVSPENSTQYRFATYRPIVKAFTPLNPDFPSKPIVIQSTSNEWDIVNMLTTFFGELEGRVVFTETKRDALTLMKGYPQAISFENWFNTISVEKLNEITAIARNLLNFSSILSNTSTLYWIKDRIADGTANENVKKIFTEEVREKYSSIVRGFKDLNKNGTQAGFEVLKTRFPNDIFVSANQNTAHSAMFGMFWHFYPDRNGSNEEALAYLNWSADRYAEAHNL